MRSNASAAPKGADGTCRDRRRVRRGGPGDWRRPLDRVNRSIDASLRVIESSLRTVADSKRRAHQRPLHISRDLDEASGRLIVAAERLMRAVSGLAKTNRCMARRPENALDGPVHLMEATGRFFQVAQWIAEVSNEVFALHEDVLHRLETGELVPERALPPRPRIIRAPRPVPIRAFLCRRQPRVVDRIEPLLQRRRRTRRPTALTVPRRTSQGRAPPLF